MKQLIIFSLLFQLVVSGAAFAHGAELAHEEPETVTSADLGVQEPGVLPGSPLYFFKEIARGLHRALTFDAVAKTELELKIASEKAAEARKVAEQNPDNERGISRALMNYERAQERLRERLASLRETSENPNVDRLLDEIIKRQILHEKLLEGLEAKHETQKSIIQDIRMKVEQTIGEVASKDTAEKFQVRLEQAFAEGKGSTLKDLRSIEILDRLRESSNIPDQTKEKLGELREKFLDRVNLAPPIPGGSGGTTEPPGGGTETVVCTMEYAPVCGVDGKTYSNTCVAVKQNKVRVAYVGECRPTPTPTPTPTSTPTPTPTPTPPPPTPPPAGGPTPVTPSVQEITLEADDYGFYPISEIKVKKGSIVNLTLIVRTDRVYYAGLDFRSSKFNTSRIAPGASTTVEFTADESFEFKSYWPSTGVLKATGRVVVE